MRALGLDIGEQRIGVALSDPEQRVATPLCVLDASVIRDTRPLAEIAEDYDVKLAVFGLPLTLSGEEGPQARRVRDIGTRIAHDLGVDAVFFDERLSSAEASRRMRDAGLSEKERRGQVDMVAAAVILQSYLDRTRVQRSSDEGVEESPPEEPG